MTVKKQFSCNVKNADFMWRYKWRFHATVECRFHATVECRFHATVECRFHAIVLILHSFWFCMSINFKPDLCAAFECTLHWGVECRFHWKLNADFIQHKLETQILICIIVSGAVLGFKTNVRIRLHLQWLSGCLRATSELQPSWNQSNSFKKCESAKRIGAVSWKAKKVLTFFNFF